MDALPVTEFRRLDLNSEELGVPVSRLMVNAGKALATAARDMAQGGRVVLLCGKGNNGGDGFAAAGLLHRWGIDATVVLMEGPARSGAVSRQYLELLPKDHVAAWGRDRRAWKGAAVVVDCLLGSGLHGRPRPPYDQAIRWLNKHPGRVLSCDVPSGLGTGLAVRPERTVAFHAAKQGMEGASGDIVVADIGIPKQADQIGLGDLDAGFVRPGKDSHKGDNGRVLVLGGGPFTGAPHYAGMGAVRSGADLVHVATTAAVARTVSSWGPDLLVHDVLHDDVLDIRALDAVLELAGRCDALVIGPGLGPDPGSLDLVRAVLDATDLPAVIDADGLRALDGATLSRHGPRLLLTPHHGEFKRLTGRKATAANAERFAAAHGCTVLVKGATDHVSDGTRTRHCTRGHPAMTVGGTGDVLAGACGALLAKGATPFDAACAGAYLVGCAGEVAASLRSHGMSATDLHEAIPSILLRLG